MTILTIRNVRGIETADIDLTGPVILVGGMNRQGKTSIAQAAQACLTRTATPVTGKKNVDGELMRADGAESGKAQITAAGCHYSVFFPTCETTSKGAQDKLPWSSRIAAGLDQFTMMKPDERAKVFADAFKASPTREDLERAIQEAEIEADEPRDEPAHAEETALVWKVIEEESWDHAAKAAADTSKRAKGAWQEVTGRPRWGKDIGVTWAPEGWEPDLEHEDEASLDAAIEQAREQRDAAISGSAVARDEREKLEARAAQLQRLTGEKERYATSLADCQEKLAKYKEARTELPQEAGAKPHCYDFECPSCGTVTEDVYVDRQADALKIWEGLSDDEIAAAKRKIQAADDKVTTAARRAAGAQSALSKVMAELTLASDADERLRALGQPEEPTAASPEAEAAVRQAEANKEMWQAWTRARELHDQIVRQEALRAILDPDGLRRQKLADVLELVNGHLAEMAKTMALPPISIDDDMQIWMGRRPYIALTGSEQWRVRAAIQLEIARHDGSSMVVIDGRIGINEGPGMEILVHESDRSRFLQMLLGVGIPALVVLALRDADPERLPDLAAAGCGASYWVEGRRAVPVAELRGAEAA